MRAPAKPKPRAADEVARVVRIVEMLVDELKRTKEPVGYQTGPILEVAERIAARTEG